MIYSMTGFGRGEFSNEAFDVTLEIKSVNNRYCDIIIKMPKKLNVFEDRMKNKIKARLSRWSHRCICQLRRKGLR